MKKLAKLIISSLALISLISCTDKTSSNKEPASSDQAPVTSQIGTSIPEGTYYHVRFVNYDDTLLYEVDVLEGTEARYVGNNPTREEDDEFTYEFKGWDKDLKSVTSDLTATAQYNAVAKENWGSIIWF